MPLLPALCRPFLVSVAHQYCAVSGLCVAALLHKNLHDASLLVCADLAASPHARVHIHALVRALSLPFPPFGGLHALPVPFPLPLPRPDGVFFPLRPSFVLLPPSVTEFVSLLLSSVVFRPSALRIRVRSLPQFYYRSAAPRRLLHLRYQGA